MLYRFRLPPSLLFFMLSSLLLVGCSAWQVDPKELTPIEVYTYDIVAASTARWRVTFALGGYPSEDPGKAVTDVGVCYSLSNEEPTTLENDGLAAARSAVLPTSVSFVVTDKATHYFRAYVTLSNGNTIYSRGGSFMPQ